jgi:hypothetical protein
VLVLAVIVALALLAFAVSWGHVPAEAHPPVTADEPKIHDRRAA